MARLTNSYSDDPGTSRIEITHRSDLGHLERMGSATARKLGFDEQAVHEITLVLRELGSNLLKHADSGLVRIQPATGDDSGSESVGIEISSFDQGPGINDINQAITDGFSTNVASLGYGLGTINRMSDELNIISNDTLDSGTRITCRRWLRPPEKASWSRHSPLEFGLAARSYPGAEYNGDAFFVKKWRGGSFAALIDGLGHGKQAHEASRKAVDYIARHYHSPLDQLIKGMDRACRGTRGVVAAMAAFDTACNELTFSGIGDVNVRITGVQDQVSFIQRRGIIGVNAGQPYIYRTQWTSGFRMVIHSDGLSQKWSFSDHEELDDLPVNEAASRLFDNLIKGQPDDDATLLFIRERSGQ